MVQKWNVSSLDIGLIGHDLLFVYRFVWRWHSYAFNFVSVFFFVFAVQHLWFFFFYFGCISTICCAFELYAFEHLDMCVGIVKRTRHPCALCLVWCIVQWTSTLAKMTFWYFERQRKTAQIPYDFRYRKMQVSECLLISRAVFQIESLTSHLFLHCNVCKMRI